MRDRVGRTRHACLDALFLWKLLALRPRSYRAGGELRKGGLCRETSRRSLSMANPHAKSDLSPDARI